MDNAKEQRYIRQERFLPGGSDDIRRLRNSKVAIVGMGALGSVVAEILARAGVGCLHLIDRDVVEWSNLQRQALYDSRDAQEGTSKSEAAAEHLRRINDDVECVPHVVDLRPHNIDEHLGEIDVVIDGADNFTVRMLINDWSLKNRVPWVHGGCVGAAGQYRAFLGEGEPCFRCLVPEIPPASAIETCDTAGVLGPATHLIASFQAAEAIKILCGYIDELNTKVTHVDLWSGRIFQVGIDQATSHECRACSQGIYDYLDQTETAIAEALCGRNAVQVQPTTTAGGSVLLESLAKQWEGLGRLQQKRFYVRFEPDELPAYRLSVFGDGRVIVDGTEDPEAAVRIRDRFMGA